MPSLTPERIKTFQICNHLGCEVGRVDATDAEHALAKYVVSVGVPSSKFREIGYTAIARATLSPADEGGM